MPYRRRNCGGSVLWGLVWLSLSLLSCGLPALAQSQPPIIVPSPVTGASVEQQPPGPQFPGSISGTVVDETGAAIIAARVTLTSNDQSPAREVRSGDEGQFSFADVVPGAFQITITAAGFSPQTFSGILHSGQIHIFPPNVLALTPEKTTVEVVASPKGLAEEQVKVEEKQRVLRFFPNFYVSYVPDAVPLSPKQKFKLAWKTMIDPVTFVLTGAIAGVQQSQDDFSGYGQGAPGYAKRFGVAYVDGVTDTFIGSAILPSLLKQDPRYFYKGSGSTRSRILYAIENVFICKGDNQRWQPNYSGILGGFAAGGISNLYYPAKDRGAEATVDNALIGIGTGAVLNLFQEFLIRKLTH